MLLVVIVNYRTADLAIACLDSLSSQVRALETSRVVVVDNASADGSVERISTAIDYHRWNDWASVLSLPVNRGFAAGNNAAIRLALIGPEVPRYFLLLNPDTLVPPGALMTLLDFASSHEGVGIAGPRLDDAFGAIHRSAFRFPNWPAELEQAICLGPVSRLLSRHIVAPPPPVRACRVDWVSGAAMLVRREVLAAVGLLDERCFLYFEEPDLCRRAAGAGWQCWYVPAARIIHLGGRSTGHSDTASMARSRPWSASRRHYYAKHHGPAYATWAEIIGWMGSLLRGIRLQANL